MSSSPAVPEPRDLRASDADRERVVDMLREAAGDGRLTMNELDERLGAVYAAKTYAELEPITRDLPGAGATPPPAMPPIGAAPSRFGGQATSSGAFAIMGGFTRRGNWTVSKSFTAFMLMGGGEIDLRDARFAGREVSIHIIAIMGGCEIIVPQDATVRVTGVGIMGAFDHSNTGTGTPDGPVITINGVALMGGVDVKRRPTSQAAEEARQRRLESHMDDPRLHLEERRGRHRRHHHPRRYDEFD